VQEAITTTGSVLSGADQVLGETVPAGIDAIRQPLSSVAQSLTQVEAVLAGLTLLGVDFAPDTALGTSLGRIDQELAALSAQLQDPELRLGRLEEDFAAITTQLGEVEERIAALAVTAEESKAILAAYEATAQQAQAIVEENIENLDLRRTLARAFVVIVGLTLALAHVALLVVGRRLRGE
jgi:septal ring factor EnvC (AmiA/AmiB activator)